MGLDILLLYGLGFSVIIGGCVVVNAVRSLGMLYAASKAANTVAPL